MAIIAGSPLRGIPARGAGLETGLATEQDQKRKVMPARIESWSLSGRRRR